MILLLTPYFICPHNLFLISPLWSLCDLLEFFSLLFTEAVSFITRAFRQHAICFMYNEFIYKKWRKEEKKCHIYKIILSMLFIIYRSNNWLNIRCFTFSKFPKHTLVLYLHLRLGDVFTWNAKQPLFYGGFKQFYFEQQQNKIQENFY